MNTIAINTKAPRGERTITNPLDYIITKYNDYIAANSNEKIYWYMKAIVIIPCAIMVPAIIAMEYLTPHYVWFIGVTMVFFFSNVMAHIAMAKSKVYIPLYHVSIAVMILIPFITYLLTI